MREVDHSIPSSANVDNNGATPLFPLYSYQCTSQLWLLNTRADIFVLFLNVFLIPFLLLKTKTQANKITFQPHVCQFCHLNLETFNKLETKLHKYDSTRKYVLIFVMFKFLLSVITTYRISDCGTAAELVLFTFEN